MRVIEYNYGDLCPLSSPDLAVVHEVTGGRAIPQPVIVRALDIQPKNNHGAVHYK